jgi:hypothetical protein
MMHGHEKSDPEVVAIRMNADGARREKPMNKAAPAAAELVERTLRSGTLACANRTLGRAGTKGAGPRRADRRAGKARSGLRTGLACPMRWTAYGKPRGTTGRNGSPRFSITSTP